MTAADSDTADFGPAHQITVALLAQMRAERDAAVARADALTAGIDKLIPWAESYRMHHVVIALRGLLATADRGTDR